MFFIGDKNTHKTMAYNETHLTVSINDLIISEGIYFNPSQKYWFKKVPYLEI